METVVRLKPGEEDRLLRGHPWIFDSEIAGTEPAAGRAPSSGSSPPRAGRSESALQPQQPDPLRWLAQEGPGQGLLPGPPEGRPFKRERLFPGEDAYRLCFGESDGLPGLVVDRYGRWLAAQLLSAGMDKSWPLIQSALVELWSPRHPAAHDSSARRQEGLPLEVRTAMGTVRSTWR